MRQCMDSPNLDRRLKNIIVQLNAIDKMIDEDVHCEDILIQINAAKSAMHKVGQIVLEGHLNLLYQGWYLNIWIQRRLLQSSRKPSNTSLGCVDRPFLIQFPTICFY